MINSISFGAKLINTAQIKKLNPNTKLYSPHKVSVVEVDPDNISDIFALSSVADNWPLAKYAANISYTANCLFNNTLNRKTNKVIAITEQLENLENLDDRKVLGMANISETGEKAIELNFVQVNPNFLSGSSERQLKEVGTRILDTLKTLYNKIELTAARGSVKEFYLKNKFKNVDSSENKYIWEKA